MTIHVADYSNYLFLPMMYHEGDGELYNHSWMPGFVMVEDHNNELWLVAQVHEEQGKTILECSRIIGPLYEGLSVRELARSNRTWRGIRYLDEDEIPL